MRAEADPFRSFPVHELHPWLTVGQAIERFGADAVPQWGKDDPEHAHATHHGLAPRPWSTDLAGARPYVQLAFHACRLFGMTLPGTGRPMCRECYVPPAPPAPKRRRSKAEE
jgi:hypothetical protein